MPESPVIDPRAVRLQFGRRAATIRAAAFLLREVERRALERLDYVRTDPAVVLDAGCGAGDGAALLQSRYPRATVVGADSAVPMAAAANRLHGAPAHRSLADRLRGWFGAAGEAGARTPLFVAADAGALPLADSSVDLAWSNLAWHWFADPRAVAAEWYRTLRPGGLLMFTSFGVDTMRELAGAGAPLPAFPDMHDVGDLLSSTGFADPVMDCERLTVTWESAEKLVSELRAAGGNPLRARAPGLRGRAWRGRLLDALKALRGADGLIAVTFEIVYAHAWCPPQKRLPGGLAPIRFVPRAARGGGPR